MKVDSKTSEADLLVGILSAMIAHPFYALRVLLRGRPEWVELTKRCTLPAAPSDVMQLLDPASRLNRWQLRGDTLQCIDQEAKRYRLIAPEAPEHRNIVTVLEQKGDRVIALATRFEQDDPMLKIEGSADTYILDKTQSGDTRITLSLFIKFKPGLGLFSYAFHECLYRRAAIQDLKRLEKELTGLKGHMATVLPG